MHFAPLNRRHAAIDLRLRDDPIGASASVALHREAVSVRCCLPADDPVRHDAPRLYRAQDNVTDPDRSCAQRLHQQHVTAAHKRCHTSPAGPETNGRAAAQQISEVIHLARQAANNLNWHRRRQSLPSASR
jgi:hypothetical protein